MSFAATYLVHTQGVRTLLGRELRAPRLHRSVKKTNASVLLLLREITSPETRKVLDEPTCHQVASPSC